MSRLILILIRCGFVIVVAFAARAIASRAKADAWIFAKKAPPWRAGPEIRSEDDLTLRLWQQHKFTEIKKSSELIRQKMAESRLPNDETKRAALANLVSAFLESYSSDDFDLFWKFRVPTGRYSSEVGARKALARYIDYVRDSYHLDDSAENVVDMKSLMAIAWRNNALVRGKDFDKSVGSVPIVLCTACLSAVAVDTIAIREIVINAIESDALTQHLKTSPHWGVSISPN